MESKCPVPKRGWDICDHENEIGYDFICCGRASSGSFRRVAEAMGLLQNVKPEKCQLVAHLAKYTILAGDGDVQIFIGFGLDDVGGNEGALVNERDAGGNHLKLEP